LKTLTQSLIAVLIFLFLGGAMALLSQDQTLDSIDNEILQKYKTVNRDFLKGRELVVKQKYDQARQILLKVLDRMPEHPEASYLLAQIYYKEGDFEKGLTTIQNAETHFSSVQRILFKQQLKLGDQYSSNKQEINQEIQVLQSQLSQAKSEEERRDLQRQIVEKQGQSSTMEMHNKEQSLYESTGMPADYSHIHGNLLFKMKRYQEALDQYLKAVQSDPKYGSAYNNIANLYFMAKKYDKALEYIEKAEANGVKVHPDFKNAVLKALGK
jgi:tetratricopeptide (TPR) repeat protein